MQCLTAVIQASFFFLPLQPKTKMQTANVSPANAGTSLCEAVQIQW